MTLKPKYHDISRISQGHSLYQAWTLWDLSFLRASAMLKHVIAIGWTSVRPSVRPSVTRWYCIKTAEFIVMLSSPHDSPFILVLCVSRSSRNFDGVTNYGGAKYRWGIKFARFSTNKSLYLANDTRYRHGCYMESDLSNGAISNDLEWTLTLFSRSGHFLTLNISKMTADTVIVTMEG